MLSLSGPPSRRPGYHRLANEADEPYVTAQQQHLASPPLIQDTYSTGSEDGESDVEQREILEVSNSDTVTLHTHESNDLSASPPTTSQESESLDCRTSPSSVELQQQLHDEKNLVCRSRRPVRQRRQRCLSVSILVLSIYSTVLSGFRLVIAIKRPKYGNAISPTGILSGPQASLLCAALAKSIEISFVTIFVTFLGQCICERAVKQNEGFAIADMSMRDWMMQPGTMITHWDSARYAMKTVLGAATLQATLITLLYTTASNALVLPKLQIVQEDRLLHGKVSTSYANHDLVMNRCKTPISLGEDPFLANTTCFQLQEQSQSYHNLMGFLSSWAETADTPESTTGAVYPPSPVAVRS